MIFSLVFLLILTPVINLTKGFNKSSCSLTDTNNSKNVRAKDINEGRIRNLLIDLLALFANTGIKIITKKFTK